MTRENLLQQAKTLEHLRQGLITCTEAVAQFKSSLEPLFKLRIEGDARLGDTCKPALDKLKGGLEHSIDIVEQFIIDNCGPPEMIH